MEDCNIMIDNNEIAEKSAILTTSVTRALCLCYGPDGSVLRSLQRQ